MNVKKTNFKTSRKGAGFSTIELIVTATVMTIVTAFGLLGISRAQASIRLAGAAREYASYIEKARVLSIRSHADDENERSTIAINENKTSYNITMDLDADGDLDTRTIALPDGVTFVGDAETIAFDWRGRTWNTQNGLTLPNAQVSIRLNNGVETVSIDVTGSGDVTINSAVFDDSVPNVTLNVSNLAANRTTTTTTPTSPTTTENPSTPTTTTPATGTDPQPDTTDGTTTTDPSTTGTNPSPGSDATPTPTPSPSQSSNPHQDIPAVCTVNADIATITLDLLGETTIKVSHDASVSLSVSASSSKPSELQVSGGTQTVASGGYALYTLKSKKLTGDYTVTFKTSCGEKKVTVSVLGPIKLGK